MLRLGKVKKKWHSIGLPDALFSRVGAVIKYTGHTSLSEYVRFAVQDALKEDEPFMLEQEEMEAEVRERLA